MEARQQYYLKLQRERANKTLYGDIIPERANLKMHRRKLSYSVNQKIRK
jgi:hypothetical protein